MTQKHFIAIAAIFAGDLATARYNSVAEATVRNLILSHADYFQRENPRFKRSTFYLACGLTADGLLP